MLQRLLFLLFILAGCGLRISRADSIGPYWDRRIAPAESEAYIVIETMPPGGGEGFGPVRIQIVKQPEGGRRGPAITGWFSDADGEHGRSTLDLIASREVAATHGDRVTGEIVLNVPPTHAVLSPSGSAVALIGQHAIRAKDENGRIIILARANGRIIARLTLTDLFGDNAARVYSSGAWERKYPQFSAWIDEQQGYLIVAAESSASLPRRAIALVSLEDGHVRPGSGADVMRSISTSSRVGVGPALALAEDMQIAIPPRRLGEVFSCPRIKTSARVAAGAMLLDAGDRRAKGLISSLADRALNGLETDASFDVKAHWLPVLGDIIGDYGPSDDYAAMALAVLYLPKAAGCAAVPTLSKIGARSKRALGQFAERAILSMGSAALPELLCVINGSRDRGAEHWARRMANRIRRRTQK